jgi:hypothetical protein
MTPASMERNRKTNRTRRAAGFRESPELRKIHNKTYRIKSYRRRTGRVESAFEGSSAIPATLLWAA